MNKRRSMIWGGLLILLGVMQLIAGIVMPMFGMRRWGPWRLWPVLVVGLGAFLILLPLLNPSKRGLGALFIPSFPILTTGGLLFLSSVFNAWELWGWLWPLELLSVATGFLFAALYTRAMWLLFPAIVVGVNGVLFQFCALTGWWEIWSVLWTLEPLAVGLGFLTVNLKQRSPGLFLAGLILCGVAALCFMGMTAFIPLWRLVPGGRFFNLLGPVLLILVGAGLLLRSGGEHRGSREFSAEARAE